MMASRTFISRFSPNRTDPAVREAIFVQRERLAEVWLERLRDSVLTGVKHHLLAVGPRGSGKSHLVALLVDQLRKDPDVRKRVRIAWLPEDETTPSFWKFLLRILRALRAEYGDEFPPPPRGRLANAADSRRAAILTNYLLKKLGGQTLLVVVENLDDVMRGLKDEGQKRWRAFLQESPVAATLATSQQLTEDVSDRDRPFFNFFQIEHLVPLSTDQALLLLQKIAALTEDTDLVAFLQTPTGRGRVRAIRHIAGGNHRVFIVLSEFATRENLDDLVSAFEQLLDELTPYYQERLRWLPNQQREIVEFLCRQTGTVPVKEIAGELFLTEQAVAAQLKSLKDKGYVTAQTVGRESRYELAEPLMRLCVEVKDPRREPIRLIVEFLRIWYDKAGVEARLQCFPEGEDWERRYFDAALQLCRPGTLSPVEVALARDLEAAIAAGDLEQLTRMLVEIATTADSAERCALAAGALFAFGRRKEAAEAHARSIGLNAPYANLPGLEEVGLFLSRLGRLAEGIIAYGSAIGFNSKDTSFWIYKGLALNSLGRYEEALLAFDRAIKDDVNDAYAWENRGWARLGLGQIGESVNDFSRAIQLNRSHAGAFEGLAKAHVLQGNWAEAERVLGERFRLPPSRFQLTGSMFLPDLIATIFRTSMDRGVWAHRVDRLADLAEEVQKELEQKKREEPLVPSPLPQEAVRASAPARTLTMLGVSLVCSAAMNAYSEASAEALDAWADIWREVSIRYPDLTLAVRLFGVGVRYLHTKDERVLLDLVQEQRAILRGLFRLGDEAEKEASET
jgi:tetratricopeptide (TPR) repeat protein